MKRGYGHIKAAERRIIELRQAGKTRQEIADELGFTKDQIKEWVKRYNRRIARLEAGFPPKQRGKLRKDAPTNIEEYQSEIKRLKMENELLRDFLRLTGRR